MNNLETRIREHYDAKDHPSVFELLDELNQRDEALTEYRDYLKKGTARYQKLRDDQLRISAKNEQLDDENARLQKIKAGDSAEFIRMDTALDELNAENARLRGEIEKAPCHYWNRKFGPVPCRMEAVNKVCDCWKSHVLENPNA